VPRQKIATAAARAAAPGRRWPARRPAGTDDPLDLKSSVALVVDQDTDEVLFSKNPRPCCRSHRSPS
jgi:D-alanyl-D-alanine carboxypeptidase